MANVVNFNMVVEINQLLKSQGIEYSIHSVGGCTCAGLSLRQDGKEHDLNDVIKVINEYLDSKWMQVIASEDDLLMLNIVSKFPYERKE